MCRIFQYASFTTSTPKTMSSDNTISWTTVEEPNDYEEVCDLINSDGDGEPDLEWLATIQAYQPSKSDFPGFEPEPWEFASPDEYD